MAMTRSPVSASFAQSRSSMTKNSGRSVSLWMTNSPCGSASRSSDVAVPGDDLGDRAVVADLGIDFRAGFDGAEPVRARRQRHREALVACAATSAWKRTCGVEPWPSRHSSPFGSGRSHRLGMEGQLDIAGEVALVVDVARHAMRAFRQFVQLPHIRLGAAAARAEQIPAHHHDAEPLRGEEQFDRVLRRRAPETRHRQRANAAQAPPPAHAAKSRRAWAQARGLPDRDQAPPISVSSRRRAAGFTAGSSREPGMR